MDIGASRIDEHFMEDKSYRIDNVKAISLTELSATTYGKNSVEISYIDPAL